jgi:hypothetical protein
MKPMSEGGRVEICPKCSLEMHKDFGSLNFGVSQYAGHYNHSLGAYIGSKGQERDVCSRIYEKTGTKPVALGDFKPEHKPTGLKSYDVPRGVFDG